MIFSLGALSLSAVVSQKKSKTEVKDYSGGAQEQNFELKVWDYSDNHYFLDTIYKASFLDFFNNKQYHPEPTVFNVTISHLKYGFKRMLLLLDTEKPLFMLICLRCPRQDMTVHTKNSQRWQVRVILEL